MLAAALLPVTIPGQAAPAGTAVDFDGTNDYVTFGSTSTLGLPTFTLELWFKREGAGITTSTGNGGVTAVPLVTKGRGEGDNSNVDMNYFLGISGADKLVADFEEGAGQPSPGLNHPVTGTTTVTSNVWHHAAATYDGTWKLYLDGALDATLLVERLPRSDSIQHAGLATAMTSTGAPAGFFNGVIDEVRVWNVARSQTDIHATKNAELTSGTGLVARWGLNEASGTTANSSVATTPGTLTNGPTWVAGFPVPNTEPPTAPTGLTADAGNNLVGLSWNANPEPDVAGYNVYRDTARPVSTSGSPLNGGTPLTATAFTDPTASNETTYYYAVTAVDTSSLESAASEEASGRPLATLSNGLEFDGANDRVTFGAAAGLGAATFTIETWFKRVGTGIGTSTGQGGIDAVPLVTKGRAEADGSNVDMNWFLGIRTADNVLAADFEDTATGLNHPVVGATPIPADGAWHHAAATYDGTTWRLYLDGRLEQSEAEYATPRSDSTQHAGLATAMNSAGAAAGFFDGVLDEARVWNYARSDIQIDTARNVQVKRASGLLGRWGLDENSGTAVGDSSASAIEGTAVGGPRWVPGYALGVAGPEFYFTPGSVSVGVPSGGTTSTSVDLAVTDASATAFTLTGDAEAWLGVTPVSGTTPETVTLNVDAASLTPGAYSATVTASATGLPDATLQVSLEVTAAAGSHALDFDGQNDYVTFGNPGALGLSAFTIETWFKRQGPGDPDTTGSGGVANAVPLVTKGTSEADGGPVDMNYYLGIDWDANVLVADFEEGVGGAGPVGQNHPVRGTTVITNDVWHHAAATYDGTTWKLYLDGDLEASLPVGQPPRSDSSQHAGLGTALLSSGAPDSAYFDGILDEARVWDYARTQSQIQATRDAELATSSGLVARWGLNEGAGTTVGDSSGSNVQGTAINGPVWVDGFVSGGPPNAPPDPPALNAPTNGATGVSRNPILDVTVSDPEDSDLTATFYGRPVSPSAGSDFTIVALPDTQHYVDQNGANLAHFTAQVQWIAAHQDDMDIAFTSHLGDIAESQDLSDSEWQRASDQMAVLDASGAKSGVALGNHDMSSTGVAAKFDTYFPVTRYSGFAWYGGYLGGDIADPINRQNKDNYELFSAGGLDFVILHLEADVPAYAIEWANRILDRYPNRRAIISTHAFLNASGTRPTAPIYRPDGSSAADVWAQLVKPNCNVFLVMNGHYPGESRRSDLNDCGEPVHQIVTDYQSRANGGDGWLRYYTFKPAENKIYAHTFSPSRNGGAGEFERDASSEFTLNYDMDGSGPFQAIGSVTVPSGSDAEVSWPDRIAETEYEWFVTLSDGRKTTTSSTFSFTTGVTNLAPAVSLSGPAAAGEGKTAAYSYTFTDPGSDGWTHTTGCGATGVKGDDLFTPATKSGSFTCTWPDDVSEETVSATVDDDDGGSGTDTIPVAVANLGPVVSASSTAQTVQYSDVIPDVTITADDVPTDTLSAATFWKKSGDPSFAVGLPNSLAFAATATPRQWNLSGRIVDAPATYLVRVAVSDEDSASSVLDITITVTNEDADATYTGDMLALVPPGGTTAAVVLRATIRDSSLYSPDAYPGDIRNATVTFKEGVVTLCTFPSPIPLLSPPDTQAATVECSRTLGLGDHTVAIYVNGHFAGDGEGVVEVSESDGSFIAGGGYALIATSGGSYRADAASRMNFGFNVKYTKSFRNLQGHANIIFRRTLGGAARTYQIKSNAINSLGIKWTPSACASPSSACVGTAEFRSKANLTDVTDPASPGTSIGNLTLHLTMTDRGDPGKNDSVAVTLWQGGSLLFSSEWNGAKTIEKLLSGGNLIIH